ncbi:MAG: hypothetical protein V5A62_17725 [Haloarculaceae archaeon]
MSDDDLHVDVEVEIEPEGTRAEDGKDEAPGRNRPARIVTS